MALKRKTIDEFYDDFRPIKRFSVHGIKDPADHQEHSASSSVGSNQPIHELLIISDDDDDDEVESPPSTTDDDDEVKSPPSTVNDVTGDGWRKRDWRIAAFQSPASDETEVTKKKGNDYEEDGDWWVKYGSMIVDNNGFLLGEFARLDEQLYMSIM